MTLELFFNKSNTPPCRELSVLTDCKNLLYDGVLYCMLL